MGDDRRLGRVRLQGLHTFSNKRTATIGYRGAIDLQQAPQERDVVCPFLLRRVPKGERPFDAECIPPEGFVLLVQSWRLVSLPCYSRGRLCGVPSSAALRVARGAGEERPEPGGENSCSLAGESAAILGLAKGRVSVQRAFCTGHVAAILVHYCWLPAATRWSSKDTKQHDRRM